MTRFDIQSFRSLALASAASAYCVFMFAVASLASTAPSLGGIA